MDIGIYTSAWKLAFNNKNFANKNVGATPTKYGWVHNRNVPVQGLMGILRLYETHTGGWGWLKLS